MADPAHVDVVRRGAGALAEWRRQHPHETLDLTRESLREADLAGAVLGAANLAGASLRDADLGDADLREAVGLRAEDLAGANTLRAKLPEGLRFEGLDNIAEASKNARQLVVTLVAGCAYAALVIATTKDAALLTNSSAFVLPILNVSVEIVGFYVAAPALLFGLYAYCSLYIERLWERLAMLPAVFPDGTPLDIRAYPWPVNGLVRGHFVRLRKDRPPLSRWQSVIAVFVVWAMLPLTLIVFWARYLNRHAWSGTTFHIVLVVLSLIVWVVFHYLARRTLRGTPIPRLRAYGLLVAIAGAGLALVAVSYAAIEAHRAGLSERTQYGQQLVLEAVTSLGLHPFASLAEAELSPRPERTGDRDAEAATPAKAKGAQLKEANLRWARAERAFLARADLRGADLEGADLAGADLRGADLARARLGEANVQWTNFRGATNLKQEQITQAANWVLAFYDESTASRLRLYAAGLPRIADLSRSYEKRILKVDLEGRYLRRAEFREFDLRGSRFSRAYLQGSDFTGANLERVPFVEADLREYRRAGRVVPTSLASAILAQADLTGASLQSARLAGVRAGGAILAKASLERAELTLADLTGADLSAANLVGVDARGANFRGARLRDSRLTAASLVNAQLGASDLRGADLTDADLTDAILDQADLTGATLVRANLTRARLSGARLDDARGLTRSQIDRACGAPGAPSRLHAPASACQGG